MNSMKFKQEMKGGAWYLIPCYYEHYFESWSSHRWGLNDGYNGPDLSGYLCNHPDYYVFDNPRLFVPLEESTNTPSKSDLKANI